MFYNEKFIVKFSDIFRQLLKSGTSIGANISEANGALTEADFSAKVSIAYKEMREVRYWLLLMKNSGLIDVDSYDKLDSQVEELCKIAFTILKNNRQNKNQRIHPKTLIIDN